MLRPDQKLVFIGGLHRSGTSLLHAILRDHPAISGFEHTGVPEDEGQHLQSVYPPARVFGGPGKFCFHPQSHMDESNTLATPRSRENLWQDWSKFWDTSKPVLIEKSPPNLIRTRFLQALFPEAYFIMVTRHPATVAFATQKWSHTSIPSLLSHWQRAHRLFLKDKPYLQRVCVIRYEDMVQNLQGVLTQLYDFLGLEMHSPQHNVSAEQDKNYTVQWQHYQVENPIISRLARWRVTSARKFGYKD